MLCYFAKVSVQKFCPAWEKGLFLLGYIKEGRKMKRICTLLLAAGLLFGAATGASAIDFKAKVTMACGFWPFRIRSSFTNIVMATTNTKRTLLTNSALFRSASPVGCCCFRKPVRNSLFEIGNTHWGQIPLVALLVRIRK